MGRKKSDKVAKPAVAAPVAAAEETEVELTVGQVMASTLRKHRVGYTPVKSAAGKPSLDNGDAIAQALRGMEWSTVVALAESLLDGVEGGELAERYSHLNVGQRRMNAGNLIRNAIKRGELKVEEVVLATGE
jgi:hypothetical protein